MLRYVFRRLLWAIPTLFAVSLVVFAVATLLPDQALSGSMSDESLFEASPSRFDQRTEARREAFLDLPMLFNSSPRDVRTRAEAAIRHVAAADPDAPLAKHQLVQLGAAAFPYILPKLDDLPPTERGRVAVALAPLATRIGESNLVENDLVDPDRAALFWSRFWEDRSLDFTTPAVERQVRRIEERETELRDVELMRVDTFALAPLIDAIGRTDDAGALARLTETAAHAAGMGPVIDAAAKPSEVRRGKAWWRSFWHVHRSEWTALEGFDRLVSAISETRYGKWIFGAARGDLGLSARDGEPIADKLRARAPITLALAFASMLLGFAVAIPLGVVGAWLRGRLVDRAISLLLFALYAVPTFWAALVLIRLFGFARVTGEADVQTALLSTAESVRRLWLPVVSLAVTTLALMSRQQRSALLDVLGQDFIRTARAKGMRESRVLVVHALRASLLPTVTLLGLQLPILFGGALVVEEVFALPGLGWETLRAVETHDARWLVAVVLLMAVLSTIGIVASDVAYGLLDPRVRDALRPRGEDAG